MCVKTWSEKIKFVWMNEWMKIVLGEIARNLINSASQTAATTFAFLLSLSFLYGLCTPTLRYIAILDFSNIYEYSYSPIKNIYICTSTLSSLIYTHNSVRHFHIHWISNHISETVLITRPHIMISYIRHCHQHTFLLITFLYNNNKICLSVC